MASLNVPVSDGTPNSLSVISSQASKITNVSLYAGRAEITRTFKLALVKGQNQITVRGLPDRLKKDSVRVEGRGDASIHNVVISRTPKDTTTANSPELPEEIQLLKRTCRELTNKIYNIEEARSALGTYLGTVTATGIEVSKLNDILENHNILANKLDNDILDLEAELAAKKQAQKQLLTEINKPDEFLRLPWQVAINIWAKNSEEVEVLIKYVVTNADWSASYDIRADTQSAANNINILYKASISQNTGESWDAVPLTLETSTPTFGMNAPILSSWIVSEFKHEPPVTYQPSHYYMPTPVMLPAPEESQMYIAPSRRSQSRSRSRSPRAHIAPSRRSRSRSRSRIRPRRRSPSPSIVPQRQQRMQYQTINVTNKGNVTATFRIPGYINVPSDAQQHNVTISTFEFTVPLLWHTIPKVDARVYLKAKIKNESEYTFIPGPANIYVDGSFVATTLLSSVSPQETFDCALGLDSSLRVTYHRREVNNNVTGFYKKSSAKTFTQRITIQNTKTIAIENLKIIDAIPISQDERIEIKLITPTLPSPSILNALHKTVSTASEKMKTRQEKNTNSVQVSPGVTAQWEGVDDPDADPDLVGKDGRIRWDVTLRPQETVNLTLKCEVAFPEKMIVEGI